MSTSIVRWLLFASLSLILATPLYAADSVAAVDKSAEKPLDSGIELPGKKPAEKTAEPPAEKDAAEIAGPPREQTIYIPYEKLRQTFEKEGRGVFIPYPQFQQLWKAAREQERKPAEAKPPVPAVITMADNEATVGKDVVRVKAQLKIDLLASGWVEVPLRLDDAGVISASIVAADGSEEPARLAIAEGGGYKLVVENMAKAPQQIELRLEYAKAFNKTPGRNDVSFDAPQAPVNRWKVRIPEAGAKAHIEPMIAASEPPAGEAVANSAKAAHANGEQPKAAPADAENKASDKKPADETVLLAFVGAAPNVRIDWTAKAEGASGMTALATVEAQQQVRIEEAALRTHARLTYSISRAELSALSIEVPADQKVVNVAEANVRQWSVETTGKTQKITVQLFEPARQTESIDIDLVQYTEQPAAPAKAAGAQPAEAPRRTLTVPIIKALGVTRQQGVVVVDAAEGLQVEPHSREGVSQLDAAELPPALAKQPHELSYRFASIPFDLSLDVLKIKPRIVADEFVAASLEPEQLTLQLQAVFTIERAGVFDLAFDIPPGFDIRDVRGEACRGVGAVQVDSYHLEGADKSRLIVNLAHKAQGPVSIFVELQKRLDDPNLLGPTGKTSELPLRLPRAAPDAIERTNGRLVIYAPESLRVNPGKQLGLRSVSLAEAMNGAPASAVNRFTGRPVSSFVYTKAPVDLSLSVERRKPYVSVGQLLAARVDPGVVKYDATFFYDIRYSGVKSLRIDLPAELAADIRNLTPGISEKTLDPPPKDLAKNFVAWSFSGESELLGQRTIHLSWQRPLANLEVGKTVELPMPHLVPSGVDRAWGQIVLVKAETIDLLPAVVPSGLRSIDPQHDLMPGANVPDAAQAFEFQNDWSLTVAATRYELEAVKHTSIERGLVRAVVTRGDQVAVQALYRMRSSRQRLAVVLPAGVEFDTDPLRIDGRPVALESGQKDQYFVPLNGLPNDRPFLLELRYTLSGSGTRVDLPAFTDEPAVQKVYVSVFLPEEQELLGSHGPWTNEQQTHDGSIFSQLRTPRSAESNLVDWVHEGVPVTGNPADSFPVDGQPYVFSTLRPAAGAAGSLRLTTFSGQWLRFLVFACVMGLGVALVRRPLAARGAALALLVIGLVLIGVFLPTFAMQILNGGLWLAIILTAIVWIGWFAYQHGDRPWLAFSAARAKRPSQTGPVAAPTAPKLSESAPATSTPPPSESPPGASSPPEPNKGDANQGGGSHG